MRLSILSASLVAVIVGFGGSVAIVIEAANAVGATSLETSSWIAALCFAMMLSSAALSYTQRIPIITAWSTPGAALIATSSGYTLAESATAFLVCGLLTVLTAAVPLLEHGIKKIPASVAAGILAGVLFPFVVGVATSFMDYPLLAIGMVSTFLLLRPFSMNVAVIAVLLCGLSISFIMDTQIELPHFELVAPTPIEIDWNLNVAVSLGLPLFLVTMASQNLPGLAVLKAAGYVPKTRPIFASTGIVTIINGLFGAHSIGLAAITASICVGGDAHPNPERRWVVGLSYATIYGSLALCTPVIVALFVSMPAGFIAILAGLALISPMTSALRSAVIDEADTFPGVIAFFVTASGISFAQLGAAFWGLVAAILTILVSSVITRLTDFPRYPSEKQNRAS